MTSNAENDSRLRNLSLIGSVLAFVAVLILGVGIAMIMATSSNDSLPITVLTGTSGILTALAGARLIYKGIRGVSWRGEYERAAGDARLGAILIALVVVVLAVILLVTGAPSVQVILPAIIALQGPVALALVAVYLRKRAR